MTTKSFLVRTHGGHEIIVTESTGCRERARQFAERLLCAYATDTDAVSDVLPIVA